METVLNELTKMETTSLSKPEVVRASIMFGDVQTEANIYVSSNLFYLVHKNATVSIWDDQTCETLATFDNAKDAHDYMNELLQP